MIFFKYSAKQKGKSRKHDVFVTQFMSFFDIKKKYLIL